MASDNLKAGLAGGLQGVVNVFDKLLDAELQRRNRSDLLSQEAAITSERGLQDYRYKKDLLETELAARYKEKPVVEGKIILKDESSGNLYTTDKMGRRVPFVGSINSADSIQSFDPTKMTRTSGGGMSEIQKSMDKKFGEEYANTVLRGGFSKAFENIKEIKSIADSLGKGGSDSGFFSGLGTKATRAYTAPRSVNTQERVENVVQQSLKEYLGSQFAKDEAMQLIERAYNPKLDESYNKKRLERLHRELLQAAQAKQEAIDYFEKNGTLSGFKGKLYNSASDFLQDTPTVESEIVGSKPVRKFSLPTIQGFGDVKSKEDEILDKVFSGKE